MRNTIYRLSLILASFALFACSERAPEPVAQEPAPAAEEAVSEVPRYSAETFFETTSYGLASSAGYAFSPDGSKLLITSDETGVFNVFALPLSGGEAEQLTQSSDNAMFRTVDIRWRMPSCCAGGETPRARPGGFTPSTRAARSSVRSPRASCSSR